MDSSPHNSETRNSSGDASYVTCFSKPMEPKEDMVDSFNNSSSSNISPTSVLISKTSVPSSFYSSEISPNFANFQYPACVFTPEQSISRMFLENQGPNMKQNSKMELSQDTGLNSDISSVVINPELIHRSFEDQEAPSSCAGPADFDCLWSY